MARSPRLRVPTSSWCWRMTWATATCACYGAKDVQTPHLDQLAKEGLRLTSCYAGHANCSPSRTALMTGRTPTRVGIRNWIPHGSPVHLRASEVTIATLLRQAGYSTCHVGKWHLTGPFNEPGTAAAGRSRLRPLVQHAEQRTAESSQSGQLRAQWQRPSASSKATPRNRRRRGDPLAGRWARQDASRSFCSSASTNRTSRSPPTRNTRKLYPHDDPAYSAHHGNITQMDAAFGRLMRTLDDAGLRERHAGHVHERQRSGSDGAASLRFGRAAARQEGLSYRRGHSRSGNRPLAGEDQGQAARATSPCAASISCPPCAS